MKRRLSRRSFLGASAGASAGLIGAGACARETPETALDPCAPPEIAGFELDEQDLEDLVFHVEDPDWGMSSVELAEKYLARIAEIDRQGPMLRSIIELNPRVLDDAAREDERIRESGSKGMLHGMPIVLKDNIDTQDAMTTTAGSLALEGSIPPRDAFIVERLRAAGAVILGKANMSEWAYFRGLDATSGWSARGGQCVNPYALDRNPCGSSSGSAVAAAANLCALAIGTETGGSIMCPSSACGIVGIKPTVGLWSRSGIIPISHSQDTAGPMGRTVRDCAILLGALTGVDPKDPATITSEGRALSDYTEHLDNLGLYHSTIGVARNFSFSQRVDELFQEAVYAMLDEGATLVDPANLPTAAWRDELSLVVLEYEFKANLNAYLASLGPDAPVKTLEEIIEFNNEHSDLEMPHFGQERLIAAQKRGPLSDAEYQRAVATIQSRTRGAIDALMDEHGLDAIVAPTRGPAWKTDPINGDSLGGGSSAGPAAIAGYPSITVPMGQVDGLPVGVSFIGRKWSEPTLIAMASHFEQKTQHRRTPTFAPTLG